MEHLRHAICFALIKPKVVRGLSVLVPKHAIPTCMHETIKQGSFNLPKSPQSDLELGLVLVRLELRSVLSSGQC